MNVCLYIDPSLVRTLRQFKEASRFIYVCSNHKLPLKNLLDFSSLTGHTSDPDPIIPVRIIPIDMTPHTLRSELVILCERFDLNSLKKDHHQQQHIKNFSPFPRGGQTTRTGASSRLITGSGAGIPPMYSRNSPYVLAPQSYMNRSSIINKASSSFPPRPPMPPRPPSYCSPPPPSSSPMDSFYTGEDRYSSFRRDFENAIDSSYPASFPSVGNDFLPLDMVKKIEERAFREGLTRGIQQSAFQVGYQAGLRTSSEKLQNWGDDLSMGNFMSDSGGGVDGGGGGAGAGGGVPSGGGNGGWDLPTHSSLNSVSPPTSWNGNPLSSGSNFQHWSRPHVPNLSSTPNGGSTSSLNHNPPNMFWR